MQLKNAKLVDRGTRMLQEFLGLDYEEAQHRLLDAGSVDKVLREEHVLDPMDSDC
jgi:N-acetylmuramic acid 6-phosphate etherase